jgi:hypothetical protein
VNLLQNPEEFIYNQCKKDNSSMKLYVLVSQYKTKNRQGRYSCLQNFTFLDEDNCAECDEVLIGLEKIDDETDALDITFVKVKKRQMP